MSRRRLALFLVALCALLAPPPASAADGVTLLVDRGPTPGDLTLDWTGGQPTFEVYSATDASVVVLPANSLGTTEVRTFVTPEGPESLLFFLVTTPCVISGGELCDGEDNDCNGDIDEPGAEASCTLPNATEACEDGGCVIDFCDVGYADCDSASGTGCEYAIANFDNDPQNCGTCNFACTDPANAAPQCAGGDCGYACDGGFHDCDENGANGCELSDGDLSTDSQNCGDCGVECTLPNGLGVCFASACQPLVAQCDPDYYDINGIAGDGCEYFCVFQNPNDSPDDAFVDANCDGIDGNASTAIFVSPTGNNANPGTMALPVQTVAVGIARAVSLIRTEVYLDQGLYLEHVNLVSGISLHGGYSRAAGWARSASFISEIRNSAPVAGVLAAVSCAGIASPTKLDRLRIVTTAATPGVNNHAVRTSGCSGLTINSCTVIAGNGGAGSSGTPGSLGANGGGGGGGFPGSCDGNQGNGGPAGPSTCGRAGGSGGNGGAPGQNNGFAGAQGVGPTPGGNGGLWGDPGGAGTNGVNGASGGPGTHGFGAGGGGVVGANWVGNAGGTGAPGTPGNGGGGGGGGGAQQCFFCDDGGGNGGGGGGAGGCAGGPGGGGSAGGASFGVFFVNSSGASITNSTIQSGSGGVGGAGPAGGNGGTGGPSGPGANVCAPAEVGRGGNGGTGGAGGAGGAGGGGAGGPTYSVYRHLSAVTLTGNVLLHGAGGPGGASPGNPGAAGAAGTLF